MLSLAGDSGLPPAVACCSLSGDIILNEAFFACQLKSVDFQSHVLPYAELESRGLDFFLYALSDES
jgi:hypothetical protein